MHSTVHIFEFPYYTVKCRKIRIFQSLRFYVKSVFENVSLPKSKFWKFCLMFYWFSLFRIIVSLNVNHTVDSQEPHEEGQEPPEMKSYPNFEIDLVKSSGKTLSFSCSFIKPDENPPTSGDETFEDLFAIGKILFFRQIIVDFTKFLTLQMKSQCLKVKTGQTKVMQ